MFSTHHHTSRQKTSQINLTKIHKTHKIVEKYTERIPDQAGKQTTQIYSCYADGNIRTGAESAEREDAAKRAGFKFSQLSSRSTLDAFVLRVVLPRVSDTFPSFVVVFQVSFFTCGYLWIITIACGKNILYKRLVKLCFIIIVCLHPVCR